MNSWAINFIRSILSPLIGESISLILFGVIVLDSVLGITISLRREGILILIVFLILRALEVLLTALKVFLIILEAGIICIIAFLDLIVVMGVIIKYIRV